MKEYWIVDLVARTVEVHRLTPEGYKLAKTCALDDTLTSSLLPGFNLDVASIFSF